MFTFFVNEESKWDISLFFSLMGAGIDSFEHTRTYKVPQSRKYLSLRPETLSEYGHNKVLAHDTL